MSIRSRLSPSDRGFSFEALVAMEPEAPLVVFLLPLPGLDCRRMFDKFSLSFRWSAVEDFFGGRGPFRLKVATAAWLPCTGEGPLACPAFWFSFSSLLNSLRAFRLVPNRKASLANRSCCLLALSRF